ncbi:hypothetical protein V8C42DRAFT_336314 [Trichoderma barbatum]
MIIFARLVCAVVFLASSIYASKYKPEFTSVRELPESQGCQSPNASYGVLISTLHDPWYSVRLTYAVLLNPQCSGHFLYNFLEVNT